MTKLRHFKAWALASACLGVALPASASASASAGAPAHGHAKATAASKRPIHYRGKNREGDPISFTFSGSRISNVKAYGPTLCLPTEGLPLSGTDAFDPPGTFVLGHLGKATAKRHNAMWDTSDVTKNFTFSAKRGRNGRITGSLHADYSFLMLIWTYPMSSRPYVCTTDSTFSAKPKR